MCSHRLVILRQSAKFRLNQTIGGVLISQDGGHRVGKLLASSVLVTAFV